MSSWFGHRESARALSLWPLFVRPLVELSAQGHIHVYLRDFPWVYSSEKRVMLFASRPFDTPRDCTENWCYEWGLE